MEPKKVQDLVEVLAHAPPNNYRAAIIARNVSNEKAYFAGLGWNPEFRIPDSGFRIPLLARRRNPSCPSKLVAASQNLLDGELNTGADLLQQGRVNLISRFEA